MRRIMTSSLRNVRAMLFRHISDFSRMTQVRADPLLLRRLQNLAKLRLDLLLGRSGPSVALEILSPYCLLGWCRTHLPEYILHCASVSVVEVPSPGWE